MGRAMKRPLTVLVALLAALTMVIGVQGCSRAVDGSAVKAGAGPRNNDSEKTYPNLLKECEVLTEDILAETVGADPLDIQSTFVGAVCRWQAANPGGLIDITRFWFELGDLENEREAAQAMNFPIEDRRVAGVQSIVMKNPAANGACGVASDASGVVGWWVNPQAPGIDACAMAIKLMELTLATNS